MGWRCCEFVIFHVDMKHVIYLFIVLLCATSCATQQNAQPGICLSFDDRTVEGWYALRPLFDSYDAKATFFITQPDSLSNTEVRMLKELENDGHEIGFHGAMHVYAEHYIKEYSYAEYLEKEIESGLKSMQNHGFECSSFAYPYGSKYWFTDYLLLKRFESIRSVSALKKNQSVSELDDIYYEYDGDRTLFALGIDRNSELNERDILHAMKRVRENKEVLMLYGHRPTENTSDTYTFDPKFLEFILQQAQADDFQFFLVKELTSN